MKRLFINYGRVVECCLHLKYGKTRRNLYIQPPGLPYYLREAVLAIAVRFDTTERHCKSVGGSRAWTTPLRQHSKYLVAGELGRPHVHSTTEPAVPWLKLIL